MNIGCVLFEKAYYGHTGYRVSVLIDGDDGLEELNIGDILLNRYGSGTYLPLPKVIHTSNDLTQITNKLISINKEVK